MKKRTRARENEAIENLVMNAGIFLMLQSAAFVTVALILGGLR